MSGLVGDTAVALRATAHGPCCSSSFEPLVESGTNQGNESRLRGDEESVELRFIALDEGTSAGTWLLPIPLLLRAGFKQFCTLAAGASMLITPRSFPHCLRVAANKLLYLDGCCPEPGIIVVGAAVPGIPVALCADTGANVGVAGPNWRAVLLLDEGPPSSVRAAGGKMLRSVGGGKVRIVFNNPEGARLVRAPVATLGLSDEAAGWRCPVPEGIGVVQLYEGASAWEVQVEASGRPTVWRRGSRLPPIRTFDQLCARFGVHTEEAARALAKASDGVELQGPWKLPEMSAAIYEGAQRRRPVRRHGTQAAAVVASAVAPGERWRGDIATFEEDLLGNRCALILVDLASDLPRVLPMVDKTAETVTATLEEHRQWVQRGGRRMRELRFDCDPSLVTSHNGIELNDSLREYLNGLGALTFDVGFSAPHTHAQNGRAERMAGRLYAQMNVNLHRSYLGTILQCEMLISAAVQVAAQPQPGAETAERRERSPYELYHGKRFAADAMIGFPGQCAHAWIPGTKANRGDQKSEPCLFLRPSERSAGFVVLLLRNGRRKDCFHVVLVDAVGALPMLLAWNDKLCRPGGAARLRGDAWHESVRRLFVETIDAEFQHTVCLVSPLSGAPVRLVTALDPERRELLMLREEFVECVEAEDLRNVSTQGRVEDLPRGPEPADQPAGSSLSSVDTFAPVRGLGIGKLEPWFGGGLSGLTVALLFSSLRITPSRVSRGSVSPSIRKRLL
jgi:hypothetical protein